MTIQITKKSVTRTMPKQWAVTINLKLLEGTEELFSQDFSEDYNTGGTVEETVGKFKEKMQKAIDQYKAEMQLFNHPQMDNAITSLQNNLTV